MNNIYSYTKDELVNYFVSINEKAYKATQLFDWLYKKRITSFNEITNMKKDVLDKLKKDFIFQDISIIKKEVGKDVAKYLFVLSDGEI